MRFSLLLACCLSAAAQVPTGFTPIFNGKDLSGWHVSEVNHHGNTKAWTIRDGVLSVTQDPPGNGGILLTDKKYRDFEISLEVKPDCGCDGGLFLRSNEKGQAYQVTIDYLDGGTVCGIYGEGLARLEGTGKRNDSNWRQYWKTNDWNLIRARIEGEAPHIQVWLNGTQVVDWKDTANHLPDNATDGMIALQAHMSGKTPSPKARWKAGGYHRFRNIVLKELKP